MHEFNASLWDIYGGGDNGYQIVGLELKVRNSGMSLLYCDFIGMDDPTAMMS